MLRSLYSGFTQGLVGEGGRERQTETDRQTKEGKLCEKGGKGMGVCMCAEADTVKMVSAHKCNAI